MYYSTSEDTTTDTESSSEELSISEILKNKRALLNWSYKNRIYDSIKYKYTFTDTDFNNFIIAATTGKSNSFIRKNYTHTSKEKTIIEYMFNNFSPNDKQLKLITMCYKTNTYSKGFMWLDVLIKRKYVFSKVQLDLISSIDYPGMINLFDDKGISTEMFKQYGKMILNGYIGQDEIDKIKNYKGEITTDNLQLLFTDSYYDSNEELFIIEAINKTVNINESIYQTIIDKGITNYNIINSLLLKQKCKPSNEFVIYLIKLPILNKNLDLLFRIIKLGFQIDETVLNKLVVYNYCVYNPINDIDFNELGINFDELINLNLNANYQKNKENKENKNYKKGKKKYAMPKKTKYTKKYVADSEEDCEYISSSEESYDMQYDPETYIKIYTIDLFKLLNIQPTIETLKKICKYCSVNVFDRFITTYKITPNKECLDKSVSSLNQEMIIKIICYKINPDIDTFNKMFKGENNPRKFRETTELLIKNGLKITISELEMLLMNHTFVDDLERFGIDYDEKLYFMCYKHSCYPESYEKKYTINCNVLEMRNMCKKNIKLEQFKKFLENKNIKPDKYCVDNAYINGNRTLIDYLTRELKGYPSIFVLLKTSKYTIEFKNEWIGNQLNITHLDMINTF